MICLYCFIFKHNRVFQLTLKAPFTTTVALVVSVDQDQAAQNVQPDL